MDSLRFNSVNITHKKRPVLIYWLQQYLVKISKFNVALRLVLYPLVLSIIAVNFFSASLVLANSEQKKVIAITEIVEHPSLQQAKQGILDELKHQGFEINKNLEVIEKNAQGSIANSLMIAKQFIAINPDVIVPISTPSAQTAVKASAGTDIPIIFSSVTDPVSAGLVTDIAKAEEKIGGAIDYPLIQEEIDLIVAMVPTAKKIGFLYSAGEANSVKTVELMKNALAGRLEYVDSQVASSNQITQNIDALIGRIDVIYVPSDNTVFSAMPKLVQLSRKHKLPVFSSDPDSVKQGLLACIGYTQYEVGRTAGRILARHLAGEKNIAVEKPEKVQIFVNKTTAEIIGIEIPTELLGIKIDVVGEK